MDFLHIAFFVLGIYCGLKTDEWRREAEEEIKQHREERND